MKIYKAKGLAYLKYDNDTFTGSLNNALSDEDKNSLKENLHIENGDVLLIVADE